MRSVGPMLLVPTLVTQSTVHGLGLHAAEDIPAGTPVWRLALGICDLTATRRQLLDLPRPAQRMWVHYGYRFAPEFPWVLPGDDTRFLNHSDEPNLGQVEEVTDDRTDMALRDIAAGEELFSDYREFDGDFDVRFSGITIDEFLDRVLLNVA